jgi:YD repeat-containing protein
MLSKISGKAFITFVGFVFVALMVSSAIAAPVKYFYDELNRLKRVEYPDNTVIEYEYDKLGNRILMKTSGTPHFLPPTIAAPLGGTYITAQSVTLSSIDTATIYYTTDGTTPTTSSSVYTSAISIPANATTTLKYFAKDSAGNSETVKTQTYIIELKYVISGTVTADGTPAGGVSLSLKYNGNTNANVISTPGSPNYTFPAQLPGSYTMTLYKSKCTFVDPGTVNLTADTTVNITGTCPPPPVPPSNVTVASVSATQVNLTWSDFATNETGFVIERETGASGTFVPIALVGPNVTSYVSRGLLQNTIYFYRVRAYGVGGDSAYTNEVSATTSNPPTPVYSQFGAGSSHTVALKSNGTLWAWGSNLYGQVGVGGGPPFDKINPTQIGTGNTWVSVAAGDSHTVALKSDGTLWAWGRNNYGQLGDGTAVDKPAPVKIGTGNTWVSIAAGWAHTVALKSDGTLWAWGRGPLGDGTMDNKNAPVQIGAASTWVSISAGFSYTMALKSDGTLWAWGFNGFGSLGDGTTVGKTVPVQIGTGNTWVSVGAFYLTTVALKSDGTLWAWGANQFGQLGDGTTVNKSAPVQIGSESTWTSVAAGSDHIVALKSNGMLWALGANQFGQLGDGTTVDKSAPVQIGTGNTWVSIVAGTYHTLALKSDGTLWAWGGNENGQLGDGTITGKTIPTPATGNGRMLTVTRAGTGTTGSVTSSPTGISCGTDCRDGFPLGSSVTLTAASDATATFAGWSGGVCSGTNPSCIVIMNADTTVTATFNVSGDIYGAWDACDDGEDYEICPSDTCNSDPVGQFTCPNGAAFSCTDVVTYPSGWEWAYRTVTCVVLVAPADLTAATASATQVNLTWSEFSTNETNFVIERKTGASGTYVPIAIVGPNVTNYASKGLLQNTSYYYRVRAYYNGVGYSAYTNEVSATTSTPPTPVYSQFGAGSSHTVALKSNGTLWTWGYNSYGLGDGTTANKIYSVQIGAGSTWVTVASGQSHNIALKSDGTLWAWGLNNYGQLGDGTTANKSVPVQIGTGNTWVSIEAGWAHTVALRSDGTLWAWGRNNYGQLGDGTTVNKSAPVQIGTGNTWVSVAAEFSRTVAVKSDGTLWSWGEGTTVPVQIGTENTWVSVASGMFHTAALKSDGTLWAWGLNNFGQLGDGTTVTKNSPVQVGTENTWVSAAAGMFHTVALKSNGTLWAWGYNANGQLGDGTTVNKSAPVQIGTGNTWVSVAAGEVHTMALKSDGTLWAWGYNYYGQLGDGTTTDRLTPALVTGNGRLMTVTRAGTGTTGSVISSPAGINCGTNCRNGFPLGSAVTLTAASDATATFAGWSGGGCSGTNPSCIVIMNADTTVTATFNVSGDIYGAWDACDDGEDYEICPSDTCNSDAYSAFTCPNGVALSCTDVAQYQPGYEWSYRTVTCVP